MTLGRTWTVALEGLDGRLVAVEAHLAGGLPGTTIIGMGDTVGQQAKERLRSALVNSGCKWPDQRITLALSPAGLPKKGASFDLAMAVALVVANEKDPVGVPGDAATRHVLIGELGLDGSVRRVRGVLPLLLAARGHGRTTAIVPSDNLAEASLSGLLVRGADNLPQVLAFLRGDGPLVEADPSSMRPQATAGPADMADVLGQPEARAALELAAAGRHHIAMLGPPGAGKTMLAMRLVGLLPPLDDEQALQVTAIHSVAGALEDDHPLVVRPPFIGPHHSASLAAMVGGGSGLPRPGAASLAHHGVLFLDEAPEFKPSVLDSLRQSLEEGSVLVARSDRAVVFPARFQLVLASNPCPCAAARDVDCTCPSGVRRRYLSRLSGPLMDRVDIQVTVQPLDAESLSVSARRRGEVTEAVESTAEIVPRVVAARERSAARWTGMSWRCNAEAPGPAVRAFYAGIGCDLSIVDEAARSGRLTGRGYDRVLRLALTAADLAGRAVPDRRDVRRALALRCGDAA